MLYALGLFVATAHFSLVAHRVCEHGEVEHVGHEGQSACESDGVPFAASVPSDRLAVQAPPAGEERDGEHEHCELEPGIELSAPLHAPAPTFAEWLEECFAARVREEPRAPAIAVLRRAPGRSPPRA